MVVGQIKRKNVRIDVWIIIAKQIAAIELAIDVTEEKEKEKVCLVIIKKIIMFEENLFVLKQECHGSLSRVILERFLELVNQTSSHLFGNKPSCPQGQYQTFRLSCQICHFLAL